MPGNDEGKHNIHGRVPSKECRQAGDAQEIPTPQWISGKGFLRRGERKGHRVPDHPVDTLLFAG